ncbi:MAG: DNA/RNA non-specific endonuclease [Saprospiraceae bacterium]
MSLRRNHHTSERKSGSFVGRLFIIAIILLMALFYLFKNKEKILAFFSQSDDIDNSLLTAPDRTYIPSHTGQLIHKTNYSLSYDYQNKTAQWVAYHLTKQNLQQRDLHYRFDFKKDPEVERGATEYYDYSGSGYTRGHLVPAADMSFDELALEETFFMSNIIPQKKENNVGIWQELEKQTRNWTFKYHDVYIVSGPVYAKNAKTKTIQKANIAIPDSLFKVVLVYNDKKMASIGFIIPNELSSEHLSKYAVTVDRIEAATGLDLFNYMLENEVEERLESSLDVNLFPINEKLFQQRINKWNLQ